MADDTEVSKKRFHEVQKQIEKLQAEIEKMAAPLVDDPARKDRAKIIDKMRPKKDEVMALSKEWSTLGRALFGQLK